MFRHPLTVEELEVAAGLDAGFVATVLAVRDECLDVGIPCSLGSGHRPRRYQAQLVADPAREKINGVPAQQPGQSKHQYSFAADLEGRRNALQQAKFGEIVERHGLEWGGRYSKPDWNHVEHRSNIHALRVVIAHRLGVAIAD